MKIRIHTEPFSRSNEEWNYGYFDSNNVSRYKDTRIQGNWNGFQHTDNLIEPHYVQCAIDIVPETVFDYPQPYMSEKTIRPMANKRMFIIVGAAHTLQYIKKLGFRTFDPGINETYDSMEHPAERMTALLKEIDRICAMPIEEVRSMMSQYTDVLEHNYQHLHIVKQQEIEKLESLC